MATNDEKNYDDSFSDEEGEEIVESVSHTEPLLASSASLKLAEPIKVPGFTDEQNMRAEIEYLRREFIRCAKETPPPPPAIQQRVMARRRRPRVAIVPPVQESSSSSVSSFFRVFMALFVLGIGVFYFMNPEYIPSFPKSSSEPKAYLPMHTQHLILTKSSSAALVNETEILSKTLLANRPFNVEHLSKSMFFHLKENRDFSGICAVHLGIPVSYCIVWLEDGKTPMQMFNMEIVKRTETKFDSEEGSLYCKPTHPYIVKRSTYIKVKFIDEYGELCYSDFRGTQAGTVQSLEELNRGILPCDK